MNTKKLSREERTLLEKHSEDLFRVLLKRLLEAETIAKIKPEDGAEFMAMLTEYFKTKAMLIEG